MKYFWEVSIGWEGPMGYCEAMMHIRDDEMTAPDALEICREQRNAPAWEHITFVSAKKRDL